MGDIAMTMMTTTTTMVPNFENFLEAKRADMDTEMMMMMTMTESRTAERRADMDTDTDTDTTEMMTTTTMMTMMESHLLENFLGKRAVVSSGMTANKTANPTTSQSCQDTLARALCNIIS